jgi:MFS family permease
MAGLLSRTRIVAGPGFNRWLVPPAALAIHLSIGQAYAFSVFKLPLTKVLGITNSTAGDWKQTELAWIFTIAIVFLGLSAAVFGRWLEHAGPRKSGFVAACCWALGFFVSAVGVRFHNIWLLYLGYGVLGGCGLGLGYITPVSTLIKWFPDRRGMATGMAIMGFGGGAMIASPLSQMLLDHYKSPTSAGVAMTFVTLGAIYLVAMLSGAFLFRVPEPGWKPAGWNPPAADSGTLITRRHVHVDNAIKTVPFYFLWAVLFLNVTAGIGILEQASPMIQEMFKGVVKPSAAAGFVGLLSLFNMAGRFGWSSLSDRIGRKRTYAAFFTLGPVLYLLLPYAGRIGSVELFVCCAALILTMYGGGFATIPAYLSDLFGTQYVGAIHGRLLTAWSAAGVAGPVLVNYIREYQIDRGVPAAQAYNVTMYLMAGLLVLGFFANLAVRPVDDRFFMSEDEVTREQEIVAAGGRV